MSLGDEWAETTPASVSKLNVATLVFGTGAYLASLNKIKHRLGFCTSTGSGFIVNHTYIVNSAQDEWIDIGASGAHTHTSASDGGNFVNVYQANSKFMELALTKTGDLDKAKWIETLVTTGTTANDTDGTTGERSLKLLTGTTSGGAATLSYPHLQLDFSKRALFQFKARLSATTALAMHNGVGADDVTAADSNTIKFNAEVCTVTNTNWWLRTANGSGNTTSDTGIAFTTSRVGIKILHLPDLGTPETDMYVDAGTVLQKTSNIPITGATADINLVKHSLKNSTTADKNAFIYARRLAYMVSDDWN